MENLTHYPLILFIAAFVGLWLGAAAGSWLRQRGREVNEEQTEDLGIVLGATLTLLALIIGFSVSMASSRYEQRKGLEEAEADAIGTELLRADLLPSDHATNVRRLLGAYLDQRILFFLNRDEARQTEIDQSTGQLQTDLWASVRGSASTQPTPITALVPQNLQSLAPSGARMCVPSSRLFAERPPLWPPLPLKSFQDLRNGEARRFLARRVFFECCKTVVLRHRPGVRGDVRFCRYFAMAALAASIFAFTASRLKLAPLCIGGNSIAVIASFSTYC